MINKFSQPHHWNHWITISILNIPFVEENPFVRRHDRQKNAKCRMEYENETSPGNRPNEIWKSSSRDIPTCMKFKL
jgi:hypothetical protein